jgi:hypothetical protein
MKPERDAPILCPSAHPGMEGSVAFGVVEGTAHEPRVRWIEKPVPVTPELLALTGPLPPTQVLRIAAPCQATCCHFDGADCRLAAKLIPVIPSVTDFLPPCHIRPDCRWFLQEGKAACQRCPQIVTYSSNPTDELSRAATPDGRLET